MVRKKTFLLYRIAKEDFDVHDREAENEGRDLGRVVEIGGNDREVGTVDLDREVGTVDLDPEVETGVRGLDLVIVTKNVLQVFIESYSYTYF